MDSTEVTRKSQRLNKLHYLDDVVYLIDTIYEFVNERLEKMKTDS